MNIVLIGMRCTGKTTVGRLLAQSVHRDFIEIDELIAKKSGHSIADLVRVFGWEHFRDLEALIVGEVAHRSDAVISTGGGVVLRNENVNTLKRSGFLILLTASVDAMVQRMGNTADRPPLTGKQKMRDEVVEVLNERRLLYEKACDVRVSTDKKSPTEVEQSILEIMKEKHI